MSILPANRVDEGSSHSVFSKTKIRSEINGYFLKRARSHYLKWVIDEEWSIRYYFLYDHKPELSKSYVLKSHEAKIYIKLSTAEALDYIRYKCESIHPVELFSVLSRGNAYCRATIDHLAGNITHNIEPSLRRRKK